MALIKEQLPTQASWPLCGMDAIYSRLPVEKDKFRVLRIKEARHSDDGPGLSFSLKLNDNADDDVRDVYAAVSYTWGGQPFDHIIKVDEVDYAVTRSCAQALEEVHKCGYTSVWIDQVCINQTDLGERGAQISLMSRIYAAAAEVVIWLGPFNELTFTPTYLEQSEMLYVDPEQSADSFHVLQQAGTTVRTVGTAEDKLALEVVALIRGVGLAFKKGALQQGRVGGRATAAAWERALGIVTSRYFGRRWINQEVVHNDIVSIRLGSQMIDYPELDCFVHGLLDGRSVLFDKDIEDMLEDRDVGSLTGLWRITGTANMRHRMRRQLNQNQPLAPRTPPPHLRPSQHLPPRWPLHPPPATFCDRNPPRPPRPPNLLGPRLPRSIPHLNHSRSQNNHNPHILDRLRHVIRRPINKPRRGGIVLAEYVDRKGV